MDCGFLVPLPPRYLLYRVLEPLGPYIVGTWRVRGRLCYRSVLRASVGHHGVATASGLEPEQRLEPGQLGPKR